MKKILLTLSLSLFGTLAACAVENPWLGTWKLDPSKSQLAGTTFTYSQAANGLLHYRGDYAISFDFGTDGKEYTTYLGRSTIWTALGDHAWDNVVKFNGKVVSTAHRALSNDDKTLTITSNGTNPDGSHFTGDFSYTRVTGTTGLIGTWKSTKANISDSEIYVILAMDANSVRWEDVTYKMTVSGKPDGSDIPVIGQAVPQGVTLTITLDSARQYSQTNKENGKIVHYSTETLSADGRSIKEVTWEPGKESEKVTSTFIKQ